MTTPRPSRSSSSTSTRSPAERTGGEDVAAWAARRTEVAARLRRALHVEVSAGPGDLRFVDFAYELAPQEVSLGLDDAGEHFFWATAQGRHLFIRKVNIEEQRVVEAVALVTPLALSFALLLSTRTWDVLRWHADAHHPEAEVSEGAVLVPGGRFLWLSVRPRTGHDEAVRVVDLERGKVHRDLGREVGSLDCVVTSAGPRVFLSRFDKGGRLYSGAGVGEASVPAGVRALAAWPLGDGLIGLKAPADELDEEDEGEETEPLSVVHLPAGGAPMERVEELSDSFNDGVGLVVTSRRARASFVLYGDTDGQQWLVAYGSDGEKVGRRWRAAAPARSLLLQDATAARACLAVASPEGVRCVLLTADSPEGALQGVADDEAPFPRLSTQPSLCTTPWWTSEGARVTDFIHRQTTPEARQKALAQALETSGEKPEALAQLAHDLRRWRLPEAAAEVTKLAALRFSGHPVVQLDAAQAAIEQGDWEGALATLEVIPPEALKKGAQHLHHLRGLALYRLGRLAEAREAFVIAGRGDTPCSQVGGWPDWLDALQAGDGSSATGAARLLALVREADLALAAGEASRALGLLDVATVWRCLDVQLGARLVTAAVGCGGEGARLRLRLIAAAFLHLRESRYAGMLPLGPMQWSEEKLVLTEERARASLGEVTG